jgi:hypothetical protein
VTHRTQPIVTALEAKDLLAQLEAERALAQTTALGDVDAYMGDLEDEIVSWRQVYVAAAVTEIASLRAELFGAQVG